MPSCPKFEYIYVMWNSHDFRQKENTLEFHLVVVLVVMITSSIV